VIGVIHFDLGGLVDVREADVGAILSDPAVVAAVSAVDAAATPQARIEAVAQLLEWLE
jgi:hypothetical protein